LGFCLCYCEALALGITHNGNRCRLVVLLTLTPHRDEPDCTWGANPQWRPNFFSSAALLTGRRADDQSTVRAATV